MTNEGVAAIAGTVGFVAMSALAGLLGMGVEYVSWVGSPSSIAFWSVVMITCWLPACLAVYVERTKNVRVKGAVALPLLAPWAFAYAFGRVGEIGAIALYGPMVLGLVAAMRREQKHSSPPPDLTLLHEFAQHVQPVPTDHGFPVQPPTRPYSG